VSERVYGWMDEWIFYEVLYLGVKVWTVVQVGGTKVRGRDGYLCAFERREGRGSSSSEYD
jgi:hypothetical protein